MKQTINLNQFKQGFKDLNRNNFSDEGLKALFEYFQQLESDLDDEIEFDVISICCEFTEYETLVELGESYPEMDDIEYIETSKGSFVARNI